MNNENKPSNWINRTGEISRTRFGTPIKIIKYNTNRDIIIEFQDKYMVQKHSNYNDFKKGRIKNPYDRSVCGEGYLGERYLSQKNNKKTKEYRVWENIITRCYCKDKNRKAYEDCTVSESWKNYSNFYTWYNNNSYQCRECLEVDKDIFGNNSKIYSEETCILIPRNINGSIQQSKQGGSFLFNGKWVANCRGKYIGTFNTKEEAEIKFLNEKNDEFQRKIESYKNELPKHLYDKLKTVWLVA